MLTILDFQMKIINLDMAAAKDAIAAAPGRTFPTLDTVVTFLSHFVSQTNNSAVVFPEQSVEVAMDAEDVLPLDAAEDADTAEAMEAAEAMGAEAGLPYLLVTLLLHSGEIFQVTISTRSVNCGYERKCRRRMLLLSHPTPDRLERMRTTVQLVMLGTL